MNCFNGCRVHEHILQHQQYQVYDWNPIQHIDVHKVMSKSLFERTCQEIKEGLRQRNKNMCYLFKLNSYLMVIRNKYTQHTKKVLIITKIQDRLT